MRLAVQNFRSYQHFDVTFNAATHSVVIGDSSKTDYASTNGSGKSSILYAICFALYGKWPGMDGADSGVNATAGSDMLVYYEFRDREGNVCVVRRGRKPKILEFWQGGVPVTGDDAKLQRAIDSAMGCGYDFFSKVFIYTGRSDTKFADMTDSQQKSLLEILMPIDLDAAKELADQQASAAQTAMAEAGHANQLAWAEHTAVTRKLDAVRAEEAAWVPPSAQYSDDRCATEISKLSEWLQIWSDDCKHAEAGLVYASKAQAGYQAKIHEYQRELDAVNARVKAARDAQNRYEADAKALYAKISKVKDGVCPTCGHSLMAAMDRVTEQFAEELRAMDDLKQRVDDEYADAQMDRGPVQQKIADAEKDRQAWQVEANKYDVELSSKREGLTQTQDALRWWEAQMRIASGVVAENPHTKVREHLEAELARWKEKIDTAAATADAHKRDLGLWKHVVEAFGARGLRHFAYEQLCPELTALAKSLMRLLSDSQLNVEFKSHYLNGKKVVEKFHIHATKQVGDQLCEGYSNLSGGERARIDIVVFLALYLTACKQVNPNARLLVLDEIADALDTKGKTNIAELLSEIAKSYGVTVLTLTNDERVTEIVPYGYRCTTGGTYSRLEPVLES